MGQQEQQSAQHTPGPGTIEHADAVITAVCEMRGGAEVGYRMVRQSSQWDRGFDAIGFAFIAYLHREGRTLVEDNPDAPGFVTLEGSNGWNREQARIRLGMLLSWLYGFEEDRAAIAKATGSAS